MGVNYQEELVKEKQEKERLFKFYNSLKASSPKCNFGSKDCGTCTDKDCTWREYLLNPPY